MLSRGQEQEGGIVLFTLIKINFGYTDVFPVKSFRIIVFSLDTERKKNDETRR